MALSRDRGTAKQRVDQGYGLVCDADGIRSRTWSWPTPTRSTASSPGAAAAPSTPARFPVGSLLRILPNHACATARPSTTSTTSCATASPRVWERFAAGERHPAAASATLVVPAPHPALARNPCPANGRPSFDIRKEPHAREIHLKRAQGDKRQGKSASTQAGEFVREEIHHIREGEHGARSAKQAIAIGLSKARAAGVDIPDEKGRRPKRRAASKRKSPARARHPCAA
jgi:hypothetical protein